MASKPAVNLGGVHSDDRLEFDARGQYLTATVLADGQIVAGDHQRLTYFDANGALLRVAGRGGAGPGEFSTIRELCPSSDSGVFVLDDDGRWSEWDRAGRLRASYRRIGLHPPNSCTSSGDVVVQEGAADMTQQWTSQRMASYAVYHVDGARVRRLGRLPAPEYYDQLFFEPSFALLRSELLVADPKRFEIWMQTLDSARVTRRFTFGGAMRPLSDHEWDSLVASGIPRNASASLVAKTRSIAQRVGKPDRYPAFWRVRVDARARIWINPYFDDQHWYVIHASGTRLSRVTLPLPESSRARLVDFAGERAVVRYVDNDGAAHLALFGIEERQ